MQPLIYLHGFASGPRSSKAQFFRERLSQIGIPLEIPDLAQGDFEHLTITGQLEAVGAAAKGRPVTLIGSSMGGYVAALYAARHPEVTSLILLAPAFAFSARWPQVLGEERAQEWARTGVMDVYHFGEGRQRQLSDQLCLDGSRYEDYPDVTQPALILHGRNDTVVPLEHSVRFARGRSNVTLRTLDSGHELLDVLPEIWDESWKFLSESVKAARRPL